MNSCNVGPLLLLKPGFEDFAEACNYHYSRSKCFLYNRLQSIMIITGASSGSFNHILVIIMFITIKGMCGIRP